MGSAKMVLETGKHPRRIKGYGVLAGGTTIEAVRVTEERGFRSSVIEAMIKCMEQSENSAAPELTPPDVMPQLQCGYVRNSLLYRAPYLLILTILYSVQFQMSAAQRPR